MEAKNVSSNGTNFCQMVVTSLSLFLAEEWASQKYLEKLRGRDLFVTSQDQCYKIYVANDQVVRELVPVLEYKQEEADT